MVTLSYSLIIGIFIFENLCCYINVEKDYKKRIKHLDGITLKTF